MSTATAAVSSFTSSAPVKKGGPRTSEGKAASALNALKHGLSGHQHRFLASEDPEQFVVLLDALRNDLAPVGAVEELLVRRMAECEWRLRRCEAFEVEALDAEGAEDDGAGMALWRDSQSGKGRVVETVMRYRSASERAFTAALHELQRLQAARRGAQVPVPVALDVMLTDAREVPTDGSSNGPHGL